MTEIAVHLPRNIGDAEPLRLVLFNGEDELGNELLSEMPGTLGRFVADFDSIDPGVSYRAVVLRSGLPIYDGWLLTTEVDQPTGDASLDKQIEILNAIITLKNSGLNFSIDIPDTATILRNTQQVFTKEIARAAIFTANQSIEDITLSLIFELSDSTDIVVVADEDLTKEDDTVSVTLPPSVVDTARSVVWCIRNSIDGTVYGQGTFKVTYAPSVDNG